MVQNRRDKRMANREDKRMANREDKRMANREDKRMANREDIFGTPSYHPRQCIVWGDHIDHICYNDAPCGRI